MLTISIGQGTSTSEVFRVLNYSLCVTSDMASHACKSSNSHTVLELAVGHLRVMQSCILGCQWTLDVIKSPSLACRRTSWTKDGVSVMNVMALWKVYSSDDCPVLEEMNVRNGSSSGRSSF